MDLRGVTGPIGPAPNWHPTRVTAFFSFGAVQVRFPRKLRFTKSGSDTGARRSRTIPERKAKFLTSQLVGDWPSLLEPDATNLLGKFALPAAPSELKERSLALCHGT